MNRFLENMGEFVIIAILFNSDDARFDGYYGPPIRDLIFGTRILQDSNRPLKIAHGDVLVYSYSKTEAEYQRISEAAYFSGTWSTIQTERLRSTYFKQTIWSWVIQNATKYLAEQLDAALSADPAYLGLLEVDFSLPAHLVLFRNSMQQYCRVEGARCVRFYSMGNEDEKDEYEIEELRELGFTAVDWEDIGAHHTIFDDFDTVEHFAQLKQVQQALASVLPNGDDEAGELVMMLEDLNPKLFNTLGSAVRALSSAKTEEDYAHVGISGRRYVEQLADALFPASSVRFNGRDVSAPKFKNRLWAFIEKSLPLGSTTRTNDLRSIGREVDRLIDAVNALLHGQPDRRSALIAFSDLAKLTIVLLQLDPTAARQPYRAFEQNIVDFLKHHLEGLRSRDALNNASAPVLGGELASACAWLGSIHRGLAMLSHMPANMIRPSRT